MNKQHTATQRKALNIARMHVLGMGTIERKLEGKQVPSYDLSMVRRVEPAKYVDLSKRVSAGHDRGLRLVPGKAITGHARRCLTIG